MSRPKLPPSTVVRIRVSHQKILQVITKKEESINDTLNRVLKFYLKKHPKARARVKRLINKK